MFILIKYAGIPSHLFFLNGYLAQTKAKERFLSDPLSKGWETCNRGVPPVQSVRLQLAPSRDKDLVAPQVSPLLLGILSSLQSVFPSPRKLSPWLHPHEPLTVMLFSSTSSSAFSNGSSNGWFKDSSLCVRLPLLPSLPRSCPRQRLVGQTLHSPSRNPTMVLLAIYR